MGRRENQVDQDPRFPRMSLSFPGSSSAAPLSTCSSFAEGWTVGGTRHDRESSRQIATCDSHQKRRWGRHYLHYDLIFYYQPNTFVVVCISRRNATMSNTIYASMSRTPSSSSQSTNDTEPSSQGDFDIKLSESKSKFRRWRPSYHLQAPSGWMNVRTRFLLMCRGL